MSKFISPENVQYITNAEGNKTTVILPIEDYEEMLEDLHLGRVARESENEPRCPFSKAIKELRAADEIGV